MHRQHALLDGSLGYVVDDLHRVFLPHAVHTRDTLFKHRRIPWQIHVDQRRGVLQVESGAAGVGRQEHAATRVVAKTLDQCRALLRRHATVKADITDAARLEPADDDGVRARPLAENHRFRVWLNEQPLEQLRQFIRLDTVVGLLVEQVGAVARHAHVLQGAGEAALVLIGEKLHLAPAQHDLRHDLRVFRVVQHLHLGHRNEEVLVGAAWQLQQHLGLASPDHDRRQGLADPVEPGVTRHAAALVLDLMLVQQLPSRPEAVLVDELDDGDEFFQLVFQRRSSQHDRIRAVDALERLGRNGVPVLDPLRFVHDHEIRRPGGDQVKVGLELLVVGDLAKIVLGIFLLPLGATTGDHPGRATGEAKYFALPLVFQRRRADDEHLGCAEMPRQDFRRGDRLDGLAQAHLVTDHRAPGAHGKQCAFGLVGIQRRLEQFPPAEVRNASREQICQRRCAPRCIAPAGDEVERVVIGSQFMARARRKGDKAPDFVKAVFWQAPALCSIEQRGRRAR